MKIDLKKDRNLSDYISFTAVHKHYDEKIKSDQKNTSNSQHVCFLSLAVFGFIFRFISNLVNINLKTFLFRSV